ncbi:hypothetical protein EON65_09450 [archaeon]|nr:MAG: hypothetical protein EON65_09450 [archaeon]
MEKPLEKTDFLSTNETSKKTEASTSTPTLDSPRPESTTVAFSPPVSPMPAEVMSTAISIDTSAIEIEVNGHSLDDVANSNDLQRKESALSVASDSSPVKSAMKHKTTSSPESSNPKRALRFQFEDPAEITPTLSTEATLANLTVSGLDEFQQVSGVFGGYDYPFLGDQTLYRIQHTDAALRKTLKFSVFTHLSYETMTEEPEIVLDDAPPEVVHRELVRQASFQTGNSKTSLRFAVDTDASPSITPPSSPLMRSPELGLTRVSSFGIVRSAPFNATSRSLIMARARSERNPNIRQELVRLESGIDFDICAICDKNSDKGLFCMDDEHFICTDCFSPHVRNLCHDMRELKNGQFAVYCPVQNCLAQPWNSYHVSKCLSGRVLELYIDTLVQVCTDMSSVASGNADSPMGKPREDMLSVGSPGQFGIGTPGQKQKTHAEMTQLRESVRVLQQQLNHHGIRPIEYIPLAELNVELSEIFSLANRGLPFDESRLDYLLLCMDNNPEYIKQQETKDAQWRAEFNPFAQTCLKIMRGFVPPHIFHSSFATLTEKEGMHVDLAKRMLTKKCLWLVRLDTNSIDKIHEVELMGRFNCEAQGLDIVELSAIYASLPVQFSCDPNGKKSQWKNMLEQSLKKVDMDQKARALAMSKQRNPVYNKQQPMYADREELHEFRHN